jgi:hypothetical protein
MFGCLSRYVTCLQINLSCKFPLLSFSCQEILFSELFSNLIMTYMEKKYVNFLQEIKFKLFMLTVTITTTTQLYLVELRLHSRIYTHATFLFMVKEFTSPNFCVKNLTRLWRTSWILKTAVRFSETKGISWSPQLTLFWFIQSASLNRAILQLCFFWFGNTGADAAIAILLPTLKRFSCNGAVDWSTMCFCCESVSQKRWQFDDRSAWILKRVRDSSQTCCSISPCHQDLGLKLGGYWFYTKEEMW